MEIGQEQLNKYYIRQQGQSLKKSWWFRITKKRWFEDWKELSPTQKSIILSLWLYAGKTDICFPSERKLAKDLKVNLKTIWKHIKILNSKGFIEIKKQIGQRGKYNNYKLLK